MKKSKQGCLSLALLPILFTCTSIHAASSASTYHWSGFYLGGTAGAVYSHFDARTKTEAGFLFDRDEANVLNQAGYQKIDVNGFLTGVEGGYNWQFNQLLLGLETDIQSLSTNGEKNTNALVYTHHLDRQFVLTSYANNNWLWTLRPRIGVIANHWLFYATGGLGVTLLQSDFVFSDSDGAFASKRVSEIKPGYILGAGIEAGLTNHISLKAEYLFADFNGANASNMNQNVPPGQTFANSVNLTSNMWRVGINYHFDNPVTGTSANLILFPELFNTNLWETEIGARLFLSTGVDGAPQPLFGNGGMPLFSRLIFSNLQALSEETFARVDHASGLFAKGNLGAGSVTKGQLNDEDFPAGGAYSNTLSKVLGNLSYATVDVGYSFLKTSSAKTGAFVGYNYYAQNLNVYNCEQLAGATVCADSAELAKLLILSEDDRYNSLRIGLTTQFNLTEQLTLSGEAAYLPLVGFNGRDMHNARQLIGPEQSSHGNGAMLESVLDYQFSRSWNVGLGARYWLWNMKSGSVNFDFLGQLGSPTQPARYNTDRYGMFLQFSYRDRKENPIETWSAPVNWKGIFVGGHLGAAMERSEWSDPFGETPADPGLVNKAGFGDKIVANGPLGGIDLAYNWQTNQWVYGVGAHFSVADIRGENTLFSGLGGVNGQTIANYLGTIVGKVGYAFNRSLIYINGGPAFLNTTYRINANTSALSLGSESQTNHSWGVTGGVGVEYLLTDQWSSSLEYDYVHIPSQNMSFSALPIINQQSISVRQALNVFKLGFSYHMHL